MRDCISKTSATWMIVMTILIPAILIIATKNCFAQDRRDGWYKVDDMDAVVVVSDGISCTTKEQLEKFLHENAKPFGQELIRMIEGCSWIHRPTKMEYLSMFMYESEEGYATVNKVLSEEHGAQYFLFKWNYAPRS